MGKLNLLSMKGSLIGIFITLILIIIIPVLFLLSQKSTMFTKKIPDPTPTPMRLTYSDGAAMLAGYIYLDTNRDGSRDEDEKPFEKITIQVTQLKEKTDNVFSQEQTTDTYGYFNFRLPIETQTSYMLKIVVPKEYKTAAANPIILSDLAPNQQQIVEFGLIPSGEAIPTPTKEPTPTETPAPIEETTP